MSRPKDEGTSDISVLRSVHWNLRPGLDEPGKDHEKQRAELAEEVSETTSLEAQEEAGERSASARTDSRGSPRTRTFIGESQQAGTTNTSQVRTILE